MNRRHAGPAFLTGAERRTGLPPLALYVHLPWCASKCPYCDFNSHVAAPGFDEEGYVAALVADLESELMHVQRRRLLSIFIGGGTPSLFSAGAIATLLSAVAARIPFAPACEITLEANPGSAEQEKFRAYREAGVNRLSLGVQSFNDAQLARIGRIHNSGEALAAVESARRAGFDNLNLDLMFGLPGQSPAQALADMRRAVTLAPEHVSCYQLTIEPNTQFYSSPPPLPDDDAAWEMQQSIHALLHEHGYRRYEVSAFAKKRCRHNLNYWRYGDYLGIGAGAHGKLSGPVPGTIVRTRKHRMPARYIAQARRRSCSVERRVVGGDDAVFEFLLNALRLVDGFEAGLFRARTGLPAARLQNRLAPLFEQGLVERRRNRIRATETGMRFLNEALEQCLPGHAQMPSQTRDAHVPGALMHIPVATLADSGKFSP